MSWDTSTSQIHHRSNHLILSEHKNENFQRIGKTLNAGLFTSFKHLNTAVCLENTESATRKETKDFFASYTYLTHHLLVLSISKYLRFWVLDA